jgi:hypothetical protein
MSNPITKKDLYQKVSSNRTGLTRRGILRDVMFDELENRSCFGGKLYKNYAEFRKAVIDKAMSHPHLPSNYQVAALNFNNLRNEINRIVKEHGGLILGKKTYTPDEIHMERDAATRKANGPRIPEGKWFIVNNKTKRVSEGLFDLANAEKLCDKVTQTVMSRKEYITEIL